ncbi:hypothetical protein [Streptomyces sp. enrichment culture]|uniref:hypothetical protein n=1 Tax=Streptomyces sp. enrichment culture TaxID=1795815 RepID=UPI003F5674A5
MTFIEPGLYVRNAFAEGPLADAALSRATRAAQLLDALQGQAPTMTDGSCAPACTGRCAAAPRSSHPRARSTASPP